MAGVVRRPSRLDMRIPDVTVIRVVAPVAVLVKVFVADNVRRQVLTGRLLVVAMIASVRPVVELIRAPNVFDIGVQRIGAIEGAALPCMQRVGLAIARGLASAVAQGVDPLALSHRIATLVAEKEPPR